MSKGLRERLESCLEDTFTLDMPGYFGDKGIPPGPEVKDKMRKIRALIREVQQGKKRPLKRYVAIVENSTQAILGQYSKLW